MSDHIEVVDHGARQKADLAMQAINSHERHCGERWGEARKAAESLRQTVSDGFNAASDSDRRLHQRIDRIIWAVAVFAVGLIANAALLMLR